MNKVCFLLLIVPFAFLCLAKDNKVFRELDDNSTDVNDNDLFKLPRFSMARNQTREDRKRASYTGLYCFLGTDSKEQYTTKVTYMFPDNKEWIRKTDSLSPPRAYAGGVVIDRFVYLIGGMTNQDFVRPILEKYDTSTGISTDDLQPMPQERYGLGAAILKDDIYVTGGITQKEWLNTSLKYNVKDNVWSKIAPMKVVRTAHQLVELNGKLYAIGGNRQQNAEVYDPATGKWSWIEAPNYPHSWFGATTHSKQIYVLSQTGFEVYSPESDKWTVLKGPEVNLWGMSLVSMDGRLWAFGGSEKYAARNTVFFYENGVWKRHANLMTEGKAYQFCGVV